MNARKKKGRRIFEIFSSQGPSEFLVVSRARRNEYQRMLVIQEEESRRRAPEMDLELIKVGQQSTKEGC